jgi:hypothetical protein
MSKLPISRFQDRMVLAQFRTAVTVATDRLVSLFFVFAPSMIVVGIAPNRLAIQFDRALPVLTGVRLMTSVAQAIPAARTSRSTDLSIMAVNTFSRAENVRASLIASSVSDNLS